MRITTSVGVIVAGIWVAGCSSADGPTSPISTFAAATPAETVSGSAHFFQAVGGGFVRRILTFHAVRREDGSVDGSWQLIGGSAILHGAVTCFTIVGEAVRVGAIVESAKFTTFIEGTETGFYLEDAGEGAGAEDASSRLIFNGAPGTAQSFCDGTYSDSRTTDVRQLFGGNVQIR